MPPNGIRSGTSVKNSLIVRSPPRLGGAFRWRFPWYVRTLARAYPVPARWDWLSERYARGTLAAGGTEALGCAALATRIRITRGEAAGRSRGRRRMDGQLASRRADEGETGGGGVHAQASSAAHRSRGIRAPHRGVHDR